MIMKAILVTAILLINCAAFAQQNSINPISGVGLLAQADDDDYDPFVDFSEFDDSSQEEADINFFRNGRFFTLGFTGGFRTYTSTLGKMYQDGTAFGLFLSYFFDLRFAAQLSYITGDNPINFKTPGGQHVRGNVAVSATGFSLKYFFNTQNVTRGLAKLNPYVIGGLSQVVRTGIIEGSTDFGRDEAMSFDFGAGIELPMMRNKMFFGAQALYRLVTFKDENSEIQVGTETDTGMFPTGDILLGQVIIGVNF